MMKKESLTFAGSHKNSNCKAQLYESHSMYSYIAAIKNSKIHLMIMKMEFALSESCRDPYKGNKKRFIMACSRSVGKK